MRKILILTAGYGEGHNSAARALRAAFATRENVEVEVVDLFELCAPRINYVTRRGYLRVINHAPRLWSSFYQWLDRSPHTPTLIGLLGGHRKRLGQLIAEKKPDAICSTYPVYGWLLNELARRGQRIPPQFTVVTDALTINSLWYRTPAEHWFVTDPGSADFIASKGIPADRITASGFPVAPVFSARPDAWWPSDLKNTGQPKVLFMVNSGRGPARRIAHALLQQPGWHVTLTTGRDEALRQEFLALASKSAGTTEILGWTDRIAELLMTHHVIISKAGGATTQESINALCPMLVSQIVPGQEEGNYELLRRHEAGALATTPELIISQLQRAFADDGRVWRTWRGNLQRLARPTAAHDIATHVLAVAAREARPLNEKPAVSFRPPALAPAPHAR